MNEKVTLSIDSNILKGFREFCEKNDVMLSKRVERLLQQHIDENKKGGKRHLPNFLSFHKGPGLKTA